MYKNIAIPVSLDEDRDLDTAIGIAERLSEAQARVTFIHVLETIPTYAMEAIPEETLTARRKMATDRVTSLAEKMENAHGVVLDGSAGRSITSWAKDNGADCIVIASHRPVFSDIFLGSTAAWVVRHAHCAVHVER